MCARVLKQKRGHCSAADLAAAASARPLRRRAAAPLRHLAAGRRRDHRPGDRRRVRRHIARVPSLCDAPPLPSVARARTREKQKACARVS